MTFQGFPREALRFYEELERDNTRDWWLAHKQAYDTVVRRPFEELVTALAPEFGEPKVFRPNRDVRFSADKSPYKTHQGGYLASPEGFAYYVHLDSDGMFLGGGVYEFAPDQVARYRLAVRADLPGGSLERLLADLADRGYAIGGDLLKTRPRGIPADAPRLGLLRHTTLNARLDLGTPDWMDTPEALDRIRDGWDGLRPLVGWLDRYVGRTEVDRGR